MARGSIPGWAIAAGCVFVGVLAASGPPGTAISQGELAACVSTLETQICLPPDLSDPFCNGLVGCIDAGCLQPIPPPFADPSGLALGWPARTFDVAVAVDSQFVDAYGAQWPAAAREMMGGVAEFYLRSLNLDLSVVDLHAHGSGMLNDPNLVVRKDQLRAHYEGDHAGIGREAAHLLSGLAEGGLAGIANCIGGAGDSTIAYSASRAVGLENDGTTGLLANRDPNVVVAAHELGHLLSAHHHYANCVEAAPGYDPAYPQAVCTIMVNAINPATLTMSSMERLTMRGWADHADL